MGGPIDLNIHQNQMQFDLILMDIQMPDMDGIRACELIRQLPHQQQTPVIAVTAHAMRSVNWPRGCASRFRRAWSR